MSLTFTQQNKARAQTSRSQWTFQYKMYTENQHCYHKHKPSNQSKFVNTSNVWRYLTSTSIESKFVNTNNVWRKQDSFQNTANSRSDLIAAWSFTSFSVKQTWKCRDHHQIHHSTSWERLIEENNNKNLQWVSNSRNFRRKRNPEADEWRRRTSSPIQTTIGVDLSSSSPENLTSASRRLKNDEIDQSLLLSRSL